MRPTLLLFSIVARLSTVAQASPVPLKAFAAVAIVACILGVVISTLILRSDFGSISRTAAVEAVRQVSSANFAGSSAPMNMMGASNGTMSMMGASNGMMSMMMSGMMGATKNGMMSGADGMMGSGKHPMMSGAMMGHGTGSMMGSGSMMGGSTNPGVH